MTQLVLTTAVTLNIGLSPTEALDSPSLESGDTTGGQTQGTGLNRKRQ